jgi:hypothetical protein
MSRGEPYFAEHSFHVEYSPTEAPVIVLKLILKFTLKQLRHVSVLSVTPSSGSALFVLAKVTVVKIANYGTSVCGDVAACIGSVCSE